VKVKISIKIILLNTKKTNRIQVSRYTKLCLEKIQFAIVSNAYLNYLDVPDRFGNPKVSIGLPGRPLRRPNSASDSLDHSLIEKISQTVKEEMRKKEVRSGHIARREEVRANFGFKS